MMKWLNSHVRMKPKTFFRGGGLNKLDTTVLGGSFKGMITSLDKSAVSSKFQGCTPLAQIKLWCYDQQLNLTIMLSWRFLRYPAQQSVIRGHTWYYGTHWYDIVL